MQKRPIKCNHYLKTVSLIIIVLFIVIPLVIRNHYPHIYERIQNGGYIIVNDQELLEE